jgi:hypothetical protein
MKIAKRDIFIGIGGILVGALVHKYFYSNKPMANPAPSETEEDGSADESGSEDTASFLGFGKKKNKGVVKGVVKDGASAYSETAQKVGKAYSESLKSGLNPIYATKKVAGKIRGSRMSPKEKQNALAQLRNVSTAMDNFDGSIGI